MHSELGHHKFITQSVISKEKMNVPCLEEVDEPNDQES